MISKKLSKFLNYRYDKVPFWQRCIMRLPIQALIYSMLIPVPLSIITLAYLLTFGNWSLLQYMLFIWSTSEIAFFLSWKKKMQVPFKRKPFTGNPTSRVALAKRFLAHVGNIQETFAGWMFERPDAPLHMDYFKPLIDFFFFDKKGEHMTIKEKMEAEKIYRIFNQKIPSNPDPFQPLKSFKLMEPVADDMPYLPKSLIVYLAVKALQALTSTILYSLGFRRYVTRGLTYWFLPGNSPKPPVMHIHGLGMGYFVYLPTLHALLSANPGRRVILVDLPHVGMAHFDVILNHDQTIKAVDALFTRHRLVKVSLVGHSYGSIMASWLIQQRPQYLSHVHLVDPVCFMMWKSNLLYSTLFAEPNCIFHEFMRFALSKDPFISKAISKELYIYETILFPEDITVPTTVFLAEDEFLIDGEATKGYLEKRLPQHSKLVMLDTFHGGIVFQSDCFLELVSRL